ncbi:MAG: hypothetical protein P1V97_11410 [Planctomycetota bacterium]|nr:hypothetical protein [Planctomycetota bacterium]
MNRPILSLGCVGFFSLTLCLPAFANDADVTPLKDQTPTKQLTLATTSLHLAATSASAVLKNLPINARFVQLLQGRNERLLFELLDRRVGHGLQSQTQIRKQLVEFEGRADLKDLSSLTKIHKAQRKLNSQMEQVVLISKSLLNIVQTDENNGLNGQSALERRLLSDVISALHRLDRGSQQQKLALSTLTPGSYQQSVKAISFALAHLSNAQKHIGSYVVHLKTKENREVLESLVKQLNGVLRRQKTINSQTKDLAQAQRAGELAPEEIKSLARQLADSKSQRHPGELQLSDRVLEALELIGDEESNVAFPIILGELSSDLRDLGQLLKDGDLGRVTLSMQADIVKTIDGIVIVIKSELKKSKKVQSKAAPKRKETQPSPL